MSTIHKSRNTTLSSGLSAINNALTVWQGKLDSAENWQNTNDEPIEEAQE